MSAMESEEGKARRARAASRAKAMAKTAPAVESAAPMVSAIGDAAAPASPPPSPASPVPDLYRAADEADRAIRASVAHLANGVSPYAGLTAWVDWTFHLAISPSRIAAMAMDAWLKGGALASYAANFSDSRRESAPFQPEPGDKRFDDPAWSAAPFDLLVQGQLAAEAWWRDAARAPLRGVRGVHQRRIDFMTREALNAVAPVNFPWTNPVVLEAARDTRGMSLMRGFSNWLDDLQRREEHRRLSDLDGFAVGENLAVTPGEVVFRNELFELIQYKPTTRAVRKEPILIVPAWIMKYYILDLSPQNSLVKYLVDQGYTVFCISWRNPTQELHNIGFEDYRTLGVLPAIEQACALSGSDRVHAVGYCLGGTILTATAAAMARDRDERLATITLLAAQADFAEAGDLMLFIGESQIAALEDIMEQQGYLDSRQMSGTFYVLRANEMVWARIVQRYMIGDVRPASDLEYWLADSTRMPARMHAEYLRQLFMDNQLSHGQLRIDGRPIYLKDITAPLFLVGAERDHIAPWRSVHKIGLFVGSPTTFALTGGGHNAGIVSPPGKPRAHYRVHEIANPTDYRGPEEWRADAPCIEGSWWEAWAAWLSARSSPQTAPPPPMARSLGAAPGTYVLEA